jgi:hypothetical protein
MKYFDKSHCAGIASRGQASDSVSLIADQRSLSRSQRAFFGDAKETFFAKNVYHFIFLIQKGLRIYYASRASIYKYKHSSGTRFLAESVFVVTCGIAEQTPS